MPDKERSDGGDKMIRRKDRREDIVPRSHWGPLWSNPITMLNDMDRLFDDFRTDWESLFVAPRTMHGEMIRQPLVDLSDEGEAFVVKAEVPGLKKEDLTIEVTEDGIEISGESSSEKEENEGGFLRKERHYTKFQRALPFPEKIVPDKADAELKDGLLTVKVQKAAQPEKKAKKIEVK